MEEEFAGEEAIAPEGLEIMRDISSTLWLGFTGAYTRTHLVTPQAAWIAASADWASAGAITLPHGSVPITFPGHPHFEEHLEMQSSVFLLRLAHAGPASPPGTA